MNDALRGLSAGIAGVAGTFIGYFPLGLTTIAAGVIGGGVFLGAFALSYALSPRKKTTDEIVVDESRGLTEANVDDVLAKIAAHRAKILTAKETFIRMNHPRTTEKIDTVLTFIGGIYDHTKRKPAELRRVESFADYHLFRVANLVTEYADIATGLQTEKIRIAVEQLKSILTTVAEGFEDFYENLKLGQMNTLRIDGEAYLAVLNFEKKETL